MNRLLDVLENQKRKVRLLFHSKEDAEAFLRFVEVYIMESAPGNGYDAYWPLGAPKCAFFRDGHPQIDFKLIRNMLWSIFQARGAEPPNEDREAEVVTAWNATDGAIGFFFREKRLPPRLVPMPGDLARIVEHPEYDRTDARVIRHLGSQAEVLIDPGRARPGMPAVMPLKHLMRIRDYLAPSK